ncbi:MAG: hypothetical protein ACC608_12965 [Anaerofustis sp.]
MAKSQKKKTIKLKHPFRLFFSALIMLGLVFGIVWLIQTVAVSDPLQREIEQHEGQKVDIISRDVVAEVVSGAVSDDGTAQPNTVITYKVVYKYKVANTTTDYEKADDLTMKISDTALASKKDDNQVVLSNAPSTDSANTVTVTVGYGKTQKDFTYQIDFSSLQNTNQ